MTTIKIIFIGLCIGLLVFFALARDFIFRPGSLKADLDEANRDADDADEQQYQRDLRAAQTRKHFGP